MGGSSMARDFGRLLKIVVLVLPLLRVPWAYLTLWERKFLVGYKRLRLGPNRVGPGIAATDWDALKLLGKEILVPPLRIGRCFHWSVTDHHARNGAPGPWCPLGRKSLG